MQPAQLFGLLVVQGGNVKLSTRDLCESIVVFPEHLRARDSANRTLLMKAAQFDCVQHCRALLRARADPTARGGNGWSALHFAAVGQSTRIIDLLVSHKANVNQKSADAYAPLFYAQRAGCEAVVQCLIKNGAKKSADAKTFYMSPVGSDG
eukprot:TRINITY_DN10138_c0_g1_i14.p1 TRINITY_DN10138_c0_g1~~TRINITY_DN10138_c0_g1_i14.p1  ORF type:complete len:151 (+),score=24.69 TRINITY_DN10138_c0_g1_i14:434-886(+)